MRTIFILASILIIGISILSAGTDNFNVITAEGARRIGVENNPKSIPLVLLKDQEGKTFSLDDLKGQNVLVEFIYTRCATVCSELGGTFEVLASRLADESRQDVTLVSISFDPRDTEEDLLSYGHHFDADQRIWRIARVKDKSQIQVLLDTFGITVVPDQWGNFEHNAAVHLVNKEGYLDKIMNHEPINKIEDVLWSRL